MHTLGSAIDMRMGLVVIVNVVFIMQLPGCPFGRQHRLLISSRFQRLVVEQCIGQVQQRAVAAVVAHQLACAREVQP